MHRLKFVFPLLLLVLVTGFAGRGLLNRGDYGVQSGGAQDQASAFTDGRPNLVGAMFYSAWCSSCAILEPKLRHIVPEFAGRAVEFTKFDFSMGQPESLEKKAKALGVDRIYLANKGATGFMALIDRRDQRLIATITISQSDKDIRRAIDDAIRTVSKPPA